MKVEILFPEVCTLFGDYGNALLLEATFGKENVIRTSLLEEPLFLTKDIDFIYIGSMSEKTQIKVLEKLLPHRDLIISKIDNGLKGLFTGNAMDLLGKEIIEEDGTVIAGLGIFDFKTVIKRNPRLNYPILGKYQDMNIIGEKTQFTQSYGDNSDNYFLKVETGIGINKESQLEGFVYKGLIGTNITGPLLVLNPQFTEMFLGKELPYRETLYQAHEKRIRDLHYLHNK